MNDIVYKGNIPYYKGMPCFIAGMRLNSTPRIHENGLLSAYYWRDGGSWGGIISEIYPNIFVFTDEDTWLTHLYLKEVKTMTLEEWADSNGMYCPKFSNVIEALAHIGFEGHKGLKI